MAGINHAFHSTKPDPADATLIKPSDYNADHVINELAFSATVPLTVGHKNFNLWTVAAEPNASSGEIRSHYLDGYTRPVATYPEFATTLFVSNTHDSGAFDLTNGLRAIVGQVVQNRAGTTVAQGRGLQGAYRCLAGTITEGRALLIARGFAGDGGSIVDGIGIKILPHADPIPSGEDMAIQSLGGHHRFVGGVRIGADSAPDGMLHVTGQTQIVQAANGQDAIIARLFTDTGPTGTLFKALNAAGNRIIFQITADDSATPMWLSINGAAPVQVTLGANGSGGSGLRALCVPNA